MPKLLLMAQPLKHPQSESGRHWSHKRTETLPYVLRDCDTWHWNTTAVYRR